MRDIVLLYGWIPVCPAVPVGVVVLAGGGRGGDPVWLWWGQPLDYTKKCNSGVFFTVEAQDTATILVNKMTLSVTENAEGLAIYVQQGFPEDIVHGTENSPVSWLDYIR